MDGGYSGVRNVTPPGGGPVIHDDRMHSFFLAETLKHGGGHFTAAGRGAPRRGTSD